MFRTLVIDDNFYNVFAINSMFQQYSINADSATDGFEAIQIVKKLYEKEKVTYDLILMDYDMPICSGPEATLAIR